MAIFAIKCTYHSSCVDNVCCKMNLTETNRLVMGALNRRIITVMHDHSAESKERILKRANQFVRTENDDSDSKTRDYISVLTPRKTSPSQRNSSKRTCPPHETQGWPLFYEQALDFYHCSWFRLFFFRKVVVMCSMPFVDFQHCSE